LSRIRFSLLLLACIVLVPTFPARAATSVKKLAPNYRHWIEVEVPYIITRDERKQFLSLHTDQERDSFIDVFWRIRNPDPNSPANTYKEEHYRRLAYANEHFGNAKYEDGWRTEMGRIYIILGPPKQRAPYHEQANLRPMEIWFYEADNPALPPHFYILFFKHSAAEAWRIYSPRMDGPIELVSTGESQNDIKMALRFIRGSAGDEVAKITCTLIPAEHVDLDDPQPTMESDMMLATINDLPDNPLTRQHIEANRLLEHVTMSVLTGDSDLSLEYEVIRDEEGRETLSYLLRVPRPDGRLVGRRGDGSAYYDLSLRTSLVTPDGKSAYDQEDQMTGTLTDAQLEVVTRKRFAAEGRLPVVPGNYVLEATLTNNVSHTAARKRATIIVPAVKGDTLALSPLLAYAAPAAVADPTGRLPFSFSKVRFTPRGAQTVELRQGESLPLVFQIWLDSRDANLMQPDKIHLKYVFGSMTAGHQAPSQEEEDVDVANHDKAGNFLTGRKLDTAALGPGMYRLVVTATREGEHRSAYGAMSLIVKPGSDLPDTWTAYGPVDPSGEGMDDLKRGLAAEAQGADSDAQSWYNRAMRERPTDPRALEKLAALLSRAGNLDGLATLSRQPVLMQTSASPKTLLLIAQALTKNGNPKEVVHLLEAQIKLQPPNVDLYRTLADACEASGDGGRAHDLRELAKSIAQ
jgi:GWxTD domain-containing protein